jgi:hypothetical protein
LLQPPASTSVFGTCTHDVRVAVFITSKGLLQVVDFRICKLCLVGACFKRSIIRQLPVVHKGLKLKCCNQISLHVLSLEYFNFKADQNITCQPLSEYSTLLLVPSHYSSNL